VIGDGFVVSRKQFCPEIDVVTAPAFRFSHLYGFEGSKNSSEFNVLVALPKALHEAKLIVDLASEVMSSGDVDGSVIWQLKLHPTHKRATIHETLGSAVDCFEIQNKSFNELLGNANLVISNASSVCLESVACGRPTIVVSGGQGLVHNPIPDIVPEEIWRICYCASDLSGLLLNFYHSYDDHAKSYAEIGRSVRDKYFMPVQKDGVYEFLGIEGD